LRLPDDEKDFRMNNNMVQCIHFRAEFMSFRQRGFTLVELLVVIAIIGILASMVLPVLQKSYGTSRQIFCVNNLKQIGTGSCQYTNDYNNWFPQAVWGYNANLGFHYGFVLQTYPYIDSPDASKAFKIKINSVYQCLEDVSACMPTNPSCGGLPVTNYGWNTLNGYKSSPQWKYAIRKITKCVKPSIAVVGMDNTFASLSEYSAKFNFYDESQALLYAALRHNDSANNLAADGHVFSKQLDWIIANLNSSYQYGNNKAPDEADRYYGVWPHK